MALSAGADFRTLRVADRTASTSLFRDVLLAAGGKRRLARPVLEDTGSRVVARAGVYALRPGLVVLFLVVLLDAAASGACRLGVVTVPRSTVPAEAPGHVHLARERADINLSDPEQSGPP